MLAPSEDWVAKDGKDRDDVLIFLKRLVGDVGEVVVFIVMGEDG
jgi:hypothetical protein